MSGRRVAKLAVAFRELPEHVQFLLPHGRPKMASNQYKRGGRHFKRAWRAQKADVPRG